MSDIILADYELPGEAYDFQDVTSLFKEAASQMQPDTVLLIENFTLQEAMSALEIGEPRLDTGFIVQEQIRPPFKPLTPLLPEEICWILDRASAYESEFHAGNFLAHTVHTFVYAHHLSDFDPDVLIELSPSERDPTRPRELITIVLRSAVQGLLKCCDFAWRELARGGAYDTEDWQSDKCEVSLLEGMPAPFVITKLEESMEWIQNSTIPTIWKNALRARLLFRKTLLQIMSIDPIRYRYEYQSYVFSAKDALRTIRATPPPEFPSDSLVQLAFDPYIGRRLQMATPIRVITPPSFYETCEFFDHFLDGLYEIGLLETTDQITTWETVGHLRYWLSEPPLRVAYLRSLTQTTFYDGVLIIGRHSHEWMLNQFFSETVGVNYDIVKTAISMRYAGSDTAPAFRKVERSLYKLITAHIRALWNNPPRRRRYFMKALIEWHALYDSLTLIRDELELEDLPRGHFLDILPDIAQLWRLPLVREIVLSGFQLELYTKEERSFAYWYASRVIDRHLECLDGFLLVVDEESSVHSEMLFQVHFLTALQSLCEALYMVTMPLMSFEWDRIKPDFYRRYKWAFREEYDVYETPVVAQPELSAFIRVSAELMRNANPVPGEYVALARSVLVDLCESRNVGGWAGLWGRDRTKLIDNLVAVCDNLVGLPKTPDEMENFDATVLKWDPTFHPWFPFIPTP